MDTCKICAQTIDTSERAILCSGSCERRFHPNCVGLNATNFRAWLANVGLLWFCDVCRTNFNPVVIDRESIIMKTLKDMLIRFDSMDLRVGQVSEGLSALNSMVSINTLTRRESNSSAPPRNLPSSVNRFRSSDFCSSLDRMTFDTSILSNPANNTLSEIDDNSIVNESRLPAPVATNNCVNVATTGSPVIVSSDIPVTNSINPVTTTKNTTTTTSAEIVATASNSALPIQVQANNPNTCRLRVVNKNNHRRTTDIENTKSFYVSPFQNNQTEDDVLQYLKDTMRIEDNQVKCIKLVPKGRCIDELSFISFKLTVANELVPTIGDTFYWPDGVEVREFIPKNDRVPLNIRPTVVTH